MTDGPNGNRGKWSQPGVPHKGWVCVDYEDLGKPLRTCEMCESSEIRYVHYMQHQDYPEILECGCICAGHMEENLSGARQREATLKSNAGKKSRFIKSGKWYFNGKGNLQIKKDGFVITIFQNKNGWKGVINSNLIKDGIFTEDKYRTESEAKGAIFDLLPSANERRKKTISFINGRIMK